jgi:hypothetical protein
VASRPAPLALAAVLAASLVSGPLAAGAGIRSRVAHGVPPKAGRAVGRIVTRWIEAYYHDAGVHRPAFEPAIRDDVIRRVVRFLRRHLAP